MEDANAAEDTNPAELTAETVVSNRADDHWNAGLICYAPPQTMLVIKPDRGP